MKHMIAAGSLLAAGWMMQAPERLPMKMGLWESTVTVTTKSPGTEIPTRVMKIRNCLTVDDYLQPLGPTQAQEKCPRTHQVWTANSFSMDVSCPSLGASGHAEIKWENGLSSHGTVHMDINTGTRSFASDTVVEGHFVSAACGATTPEKPQIVE